MTWENNMKTINKAGVERIQDLEKIGSNIKILCKCPICGQQFEMWRSHFYRGSNGCKCSLPYSERLYSIWVNMKTRCYNPKSTGAGFYYNKGITVCSEWKNSYKEFESWALSNGYSEYLTIDRIDNSKGYYPENCRWATHKQQVENRTVAVKFTVNGNTFSAKTYSDMIGMNYKCLMDYYYRKGKQATEEMLHKILEARRI